VVQLVPYSVGNYSADFLYFAPALIAPPMMLEKFGASASAYTYIVLMVGNFLVSPGISLSKSAFAEASSMESSKQRIMRKSFIGGVLVTIPISILVFLFSEFILEFFGTTYADEAGFFLRIIALAAPFVVILNSYFYILKVENQLAELITLCLFIFSFTLISITLFAEKYGYSSYGLGWLLSQVFAIIFIFVKRKIGQRKSIPENS
jgi:O-antigen/teichoic acid export membrane protein